MLFSLPFLYGYLPLAVLVFTVAYMVRPAWALYVLLASSLLFISWYSAAALPVLLFSLAANYTIGLCMMRMQRNGNARMENLLFLAGIAANVTLLLLIKAVWAYSYAGQAEWMAGDMFLPFGLSFYTCTQIAYLRELRRGDIIQPGIAEYAACLAFFPKFAVGPVMRPSEFLPQIRMILSGGKRSCPWPAALGFIAMGLFKKTVLAASLSPFADSVFHAVGTGAPMSFQFAWHGMIAYGLQLYFDFSGYSDIAIGMGLLFGIALPLNFDSPYRSVNISEFWRRWHMSLSFFLRDYVYIPLGGNRRGLARKILNLMIVMLLIGVWHGAGMTFILWGIVHGMLLGLHALWSHMKKLLGWTNPFPFIGRLSATLFTFLCITAAWVPFRAESLDVTFRMWSIMMHLPRPLIDYDLFWFGMLTIVPPLLLVWLLPPSQRLIGYAFTPADAQPPVAETMHAPLWKGLLWGSLAVIAVCTLPQAGMFLYQDF